VSGLDAILGGHGHDAIPRPLKVKNAGGVTLVMNSGSMGKFVSVLDLEVKQGKVKGYQYRLVPVFSNYIKADPEMQAYINKVRQPYLNKLNKELAVAGELLFRRGTFNGTFDQVILDALLEQQDAEIALSPGFRWGMNILPYEVITFDDLMTQTATTYSEVVRNLVTGAQLKIILEDIADNRFNPDPYLQQGGDMVRTGGLHYSIDPHKSIGQRISNMELNGKPLEAKKKYAVAAWASMKKGVQGPYVYDVVAKYLQAQKVVKLKEYNLPKIYNVAKNKGMPST
ncbi:5'-nucleotidase C-terminal domain-containing protein, partial [Beggiatoa alba]|nr:5'-nucleotidase C-terminal domain-containing protein [Beggiatoa alba]